MRGRGKTGKSDSAVVDILASILVTLHLQQLTDAFVKGNLQ